MGDNNQTVNPWDSFGPGLAMAGANAGLGAIMGIATANWQDNRQLKQQEKLQALQEAGNKRMADYQQKLALQMWKDTNYGAQVEQLKLAGLNPALLYGKGGGGGTTAGSNVSGVSGATASSGQGEILQGIGLMQQQQQMRLQDAQIKALEADANSKNADANYKNGVGTDLGKSQVTLNTQLFKNEQAKYNLIEADTYLKEVEGMFKNTELSFLQDTYEDRKSTIKYDSLNALKRYEIAINEEIKSGNEATISSATVEPEITRIIAESIKANLTNDLISAQITNTEQNTNESKAKVEEIQKRIELYDAQIDKFAADIAQGWMNVNANQRNADTNSENATTNRYNTRVNIGNAKTNLFNAETNFKNWQVNDYNAKTNRSRLAIDGINGAVGNLTRLIGGKK